MPFEIKNFSTSPLKDNRFIHPVRLNYTQNGTERSWEAVKSHDAVSVLLYHRDRDAFLLVKQFRPPVYLHHPEHKYTYELCAGIVDKETSLEAIARDEILEECGYDVAVGRLSKIASFHTHVGVAGCKQTLFYAVIDETQKVNEGGGVNNEEIYLEYLPASEAKQFLFDDSCAKTPGLMFAIYWFFEECDRSTGERSDRDH